MAKIDLSNHNLGELKALQQDIEKEIRSRQQDEVRKAREQILAIAQGVGLPLDQLVASGGKKVKAAKGERAPAQYRNPGDGSQTWSGRGRQPRWVVEGLANGKSLNDFRI